MVRKLTMSLDAGAEEVLTNKDRALGMAWRNYCLRKENGAANVAELERMFARELREFEASVSFSVDDRELREWVRAYSAKEGIKSCQNKEVSSFELDRVGGVVGEVRSFVPVFIMAGLATLMFYKGCEEADSNSSYDYYMVESIKGGDIVYEVQIPEVEVRQQSVICTLDREAMDLECESFSVHLRNDRNNVTISKYGDKRNCIVEDLNDRVKVICK